MKVVFRDERKHWRGDEKFILGKRVEGEKWDEKFSNVVFKKLFEGENYY